MSNDLLNFIETARKQNKDDAAIKQMLVEAGWPEYDVDQALQGRTVEPLNVPAPPAQPMSQQSQNGQPISVVENLSARGFEYSIMFITLWLTALAAVWILNVLVWGADYTSSQLGFPVTTLVVTLPVFVLMFIRLKKAEKADSRLIHDPSRRKSVQGTQRLSFVILLVQTIFTVYAFVQQDTNTSLPKVVVSWVISAGVFGAIFAYYWVNSQRPHLQQ